MEYTTVERLHIPLTWKIRKNVSSKGALKAWVKEIKRQIKIMEKSEIKVKFDRCFFQLSDALGMSEDPGPYNIEEDLASSEFDFKGLMNDVERLTGRSKIVDRMSYRFRFFGESGNLSGFGVITYRRKLNNTFLYGLIIKDEAELPKIKTRLVGVTENKDSKNKLEEILNGQYDSSRASLSQIPCEVPSLYLRRPSEYS